MYTSEETYLKKMRMLNEVCVNISSLVVPSLCALISLCLSVFLSSICLSVFLSACLSVCLSLLSLLSLSPSLSLSFVFSLHIFQKFVEPLKQQTIIAHEDYGPIFAHVQVRFLKYGTSLFQALQNEDTSVLRTLKNVPNCTL